MKITKAKLKQIIKEEINKVGQEIQTDRLEKKIRGSLGQIAGSRAEQFIQAVVYLSTLLYIADETGDAGLAFDDTGDDLDAMDMDMDNWRDHLSKVEENPVYRAAVESLIGMEVETNEGTGAITDVVFADNSREARTEVKLERKPFPMTVDESGIFTVGFDRNKILAVN